MEELEEALVIVKQRKEETNPELHFLHKVDEEQNKGILVLAVCFHIQTPTHLLLIFWRILFSL